MLEYIKTLADDPQAAATILAAFLGALFATLGIWTVNRFEVWVKKKQSENEREATILENFNSTLAAAEENITHLLAAVTKNLGLLDDIRRETSSRRFFINSISNLAVLEGLTGRMVNLTLVNKWSNFVLNVNIDNELIQQFNDKYTELYQEVHKIYLNNKTPNQDALQNDFENVIGYINSLENAHVILRAQGIVVLAHIKLLIRMNEIGLKNVKSVQELRHFKPHEGQLNQIIAEQEMIFVPGMFRSDSGSLHNTSRAPTLDKS